MKKTIAVIGLGSIGMRHAKNLRDMGYHVWGVDPDVKKRLELGYDFASTRIEDVMSSDAFIIASPTYKHYEHIFICKGRPLFVEKPIAHTISDGLLLSRDVAQCMVGYNLRFHSCVKKAKEWLDAGKIGKPLWANFTLGQFSEKAPYLRDGVILNWSHELDLALYLLGPAYVAASSTRLTDGKDDMSDILLNHKSGCRTTVHLDYITDPEIRTFKIIGDNGSISVNLKKRFAHLDGEALIRDGFFGKDTWNNNYIEEMQAFLDRIDGKETIGCTGAEALDVLKICLEVRRQAGLI